MKNPTLNARTRRDAEEDRDAARPSGDARQMRRLLRYLRPYRWQVTAAIGTSIATALLMLAPMYLIKVAIDDHIVHREWDGLLLIAGLVLVSQLALLALDIWNNLLIARIGQYAMRDLRVELFRHLQAQPLGFFDKNPVGRLMSRITSDVNVLNEVFSQGVVGIFQQVFFLFAVLGLLFWTNWYLTLWTLVVVPMVILIGWNFQRHVSRAYRLTRDRLSRLNGFLQEGISGVRTVQAFSQEANRQSEFEHLNGRFRDANLLTVFQYALFFPLVETVCAVGFALVVWRGGHDIIAGGINAGSAGLITAGTLALFVQSLERFFWPIKDLSEKYNLVQSSIAAADRLFKLLDTAPAIQDPPAPAPAPEVAKSIEFRNVWFAYQGEEWVLRDVSFTVPAGACFAVVGPTGSGKTTLMSLLCRFYDVQKGSILIDGVDIRTMAQADLRARIAIVLQDVFLFNESVAANIALSNPAIDLSAVKRAAEMVNASAFIERLPRGYDTGVRERGATLSTGQKQLISFARALAFDPDILVLDEATANIDTETEALIQQALETLLQDRTSLVIAHRLSTIQKADSILVMQHGRLVEQGSHQALLARDGIYRRLYELQFKNNEAASATASYGT